jgi:hypothetical protein
MGPRSLAPRNWVATYEPAPLTDFRLDLDLRFELDATNVSDGAGYTGALQSRDLAGKDGGRQPDDREVDARRTVPGLTGADLDSDRESRRVTVRQQHLIAGRAGR